MKVRIGSRTIIFLLIFSFILLPTKLFADWAYSFVVYNGYIYEISDEYVTEIEKNIGKVTKYSDRERTYYGNFSNTFKKGTRYYSIKGISTDGAIAIEDAGKYIKAIRKSKYAGGKYSPFEFIIGGIALLVVFALLFITVQRKIIRS